PQRAGSVQRARARRHAAGPTASDRAAALSPTADATDDHVVVVHDDDDGEPLPLVAGKSCPALSGIAEQCPLSISRNQAGVIGAAPKGRCSAFVEHQRQRPKGGWDDWPAE